MTKVKTLIAVAVTSGCASLLLLGGGWERIGQVVLSVYALLLCLVLTAKDEGQGQPLAMQIACRAAYFYIVAVSAYTGHLVISFVMLTAWVVAWIKRIALRMEREKAQQKA